MEIIRQVENIDMVKILKNTGSIMQGHFKLTSGFHSKYYIQCARLLQYPVVVYGIIGNALKEFGNEINSENIQTVISPAIGGILFGYMLAFKLNTKMIFTERKNDLMEVRRGFEFSPGEKVIIAEDVITTGGSVFEVIEICKKFKADIKGIISIIDRSENLKFEYPFYSLIKLKIEKYPPDNCPLCKQNLAIDYPGSRK
jgi:orotate phosphoribosyltransferase